VRMPLPVSRPADGNSVDLSIQLQHSRSLGRRK
jgi:hypothetical protein